MTWVLCIWYFVSYWSKCYTVTNELNEVNRFVLILPFSSIFCNTLWEEEMLVFLTLAKGTVEEEIAEHELNGKWKWELDYCDWAMKTNTHDHTYIYGVSSRHKQSHKYALSQMHVHTFTYSPLPDSHIHSHTQTHTHSRTHKHTRALTKSTPYALTLTRTQPHNYAVTYRSSQIK